MEKYVKSAILSLAFLIAGVSILLYCDWRGSAMETVMTRKIFFIVLPIFFVLMIFAHAHGMKEITVKEYLAKLFIGGSNKKNRLVYLDYARTIAIAGIILAHACGMQRTEIAEAWKINLLTVVASVSLVCNPLYVMISGALLLNSKKEESVGRFYYDRFVKVFVPFFLMYVIFMIFANVLDFSSVSNVVENIKQILSGPLGIVPHFWFIYMILGLYIFAPFLKTMVQNLKDKDITALFIVILIEEILVTFLPLTGINLGIALDLGSWIGVFLIGYIVTNRSNKVMDIAVMISGLICAVITGMGVLIDYDRFTLLHNFSPIAVLYSAAVLVVLRRSEELLRKLPNKIISAIATNSYLMILVHWYGLFGVTSARFAVQPLRFGCIGGIVLTLLLTLVVCYVMAIVADNTIMVSIKYLLKGKKD